MISLLFSYLLCCVLPLWHPPVAIKKSDFRTNCSTVTALLKVLNDFIKPSAISIKKLPLLKALWRHPWGAERINFRTITFSVIYSPFYSMLMTLSFMWLCLPMTPGQLTLTCIYILCLGFLLFYLYHSVHQTLVKHSELRSTKLMSSL